MLKFEIYSYGIFTKDGTIDQWNKVQYAFSNIDRDSEGWESTCCNVPRMGRRMKIWVVQKVAISVEGVRKLRTSRQVVLLLELWCNAELLGASPWKTALSTQKGLTNALLLAFWNEGSLLSLMSIATCHDLGVPEALQKSLLGEDEEGWVVVTFLKDLKRLWICPWALLSGNNLWKAMTHTYTHTHRILIHYSCCVSKKSQYCPESNNFLTYCIEPSLISPQMQICRWVPGSRIWMSMINLLGSTVR